MAAISPVTGAPSASDSSCWISRAGLARLRAAIVAVLELGLSNRGTTFSDFIDADGREGENAEAPRPDLILLDLNLPRMDGREVLAHIKDDPSLKTIPTVILTTSEAEADIVKSYQLQANCYLSKPVQLIAFENLVRSINDFWLTKAKLPQQLEGR